ncbi:MAG: LysM peptidoglycan-binding domain-containing protein [Acidimicrobiales bacterium]
MTPARSQERHEVQEGDTLGRVARRAGVAVDALARANGIKDPNLIQIGRVLTIPDEGQPTPVARPAPSTYTVREGDNLARVARRTGVAVDAIATANGIGDPNLVQAGQVLTIPPVGEPAPAAAPPLPPLRSPLVVLGGGGAHTVAPGQTLGSIARAYGATVAELVKLNGLKDPNLIRQGAKLQMPGPAWLCPVKGAHQFSDSWGQPRPGYRRHEGVDLFAHRGTPVVAPVGGRLETLTGRRAGKAFYLRGDDGNTYYGAHLDAVGRAGRVERGAQIGTVGSTGNAKGTTPHLHFEIKPGGGAPVNPFPTLEAWC